MTDDTRSCEEWRTLMADALAGELDEEGSRLLERHLDRCDECANEMRALRALWSGLLELPEATDLPDARSRLMQRVRAEDFVSDRVGPPDRPSSTGPRRFRFVRMLSSAAVMVLVFAGGLFTGRAWHHSESNEYAVVDDRRQDAVPLSGDESRYLLLLHENDAFAGPPVREAVAEYSAWAGDLAQSGRLAAAEKLSDEEGVWLAGPGARRLFAGDEGAAGDAGPEAEAVAGRATGFFIVTAPGDAAAVDIAATIPHLKYGGTVQIRRIDEIGD